MNRLNDEDINWKFIHSIEEILRKLKDEYLDIAFQNFMDGLNNNKKLIRESCVNLLTKASMKWNQVQLDYAFRCLMNRLNDEDINWKFIHSIEEILRKLKDEYLDIAFQNLMEGLNNNKQRVRKACVDLLTAASMQWNKIQLDTLFVRLTMKESKDRDEH
ncbi:hypothetical protein RFI_39321, partial [Reticulomyxa filosa]